MTVVGHRAVTCVVMAVVTFGAGLALFWQPMPVVQQPRVIGVDLEASGGYAPWRVAVIVLIMLALAVFAGFRRAPLAAAWAAAVGAFVVPFVVAVRNPSTDGDEVTVGIAGLIAAMTAGLSFLGVAVVATLVTTLLDRRRQRAATA